MKRSVVALATAAVVLIVAACSTGNAATSAPGQGTSAPTTEASVAVAESNPASASSGAVASAAPPAGAATGSACSLLVSADSLQSLSGATSVTFKGGGGQAGFSLCHWDLNPDVGEAEVTVFSGATAAAIAGAWTQAQAMPGVSGVGDEAHWDASTNELVVKVGAGFATFHVAGPGIKDPETATINLAKLVVPKLGH